MLTRATATNKYTAKIFNLASSAAESPKFIVCQLHNFQEKFADLAMVNMKINKVFTGANCEILLWCERLVDKESAGNK